MELSLSLLTTISLRSEPQVTIPSSRSAGILRNSQALKIGVLTVFILTAMPSSGRWLTRRFLNQHRSQANRLAYHSQFVSSVSLYSRLRIVSQMMMVSFRVQQTKDPQRRVDGALLGSPEAKRIWAADDTAALKTGRLKDLGNLQQWPLR